MNEKLQESLNNPEFAQLLNDSESYYEDAQSFYSWDPPNGQHIVAITGVSHDKVNSKRLKKDVVRVRVTVQIMDGEDEGKTFDISGQFGWSAPYLTGLKTLASMLADEPVMELVPALNVLYDNIGTWMRVQTTRTPGKDDDGTVYVNHRALEKVEEGAVVEEAPAAKG